MQEFRDSEVYEVLYDNMDVLCMVDAKEDTYKALKCTEAFSDFISPEGSYHELIDKLLFRMSDSKKVADDYSVFLPKLGEFKRKVARKVTLEIGGVNHFVQLLVFPIEGKEGECMIILYDLDKEEFERGIQLENKVKTIQETYLFSMYVDLKMDLASSVNVTELSDEDMHYNIKYSEWRMMIVNMFLPEDQAMFLERTDPEYLKLNLKPAKTLSFDCQMKNLEGEFIWVKLIFGRTETTNEKDFHFVFMVQNIHENAQEIFGELKKFESLAQHDTLTGIYNHGRIESELSNAIEELQKGEKPVSLMMLDIDFFKNVNDTYGHSVGDEILKAFVYSIKEKIQAYDIKLGRWGGEEFVCVCYGFDAEALRAVAEEIREWIADKTYDKIGKMTCSIGLTTLDRADTAQEAFTRLDEALYEAKSGGRNCVRIRVK